MKECYNCKKNVLNDRDKFCSKECKLKFNERVDESIPIIRRLNVLSPSEIQMQDDFLRNKKATL